MASQIGRLARDGHHMTHANWNHVVASRAHVLFDRLVRLNTPHFHVTVQTIPDTHESATSIAIRGMPMQEEQVQRQWQTPRTRYRFSGQHVVVEDQSP
jgi:hypothetical protein